LDVGLLFQISGLLLALVSQVVFGWRAWRKFGGMRKGFFSMLGPVRIGAGGEPSKIKGVSNEHLKKNFPELWDFASYLRADIWTTAIGLLITFFGLVFEWLKLTVTLKV